MYQENKVMIPLKRKRMLHNTNNLTVRSTRLKIQWLLCGCMLFFGATLGAQSEAMYSQYMNNMIIINPAYAGSRAGDNITSLSRIQWVNVVGAPRSFSLSWDRGSEDIVEGLHQTFTPVSYGLQLYSDQLGIETSQGFQAFYAYRIKFYNSMLSFGVSAGAMSYRAAYSQVTTIQGGDQVFQEDVSAILPTVGMGAMYATTNWYVGLSAPALLKTSIKNNQYQVTAAANSYYFLTGGYIFDVSDNLKLKPSLLLKAIQAEPIHVDINLNAWIQNTVGLGISYRGNSDMVGMFQVRVTPQITLGYAYDYQTTYLNTFSSGSHELLLRFEFNRPKNQFFISPRYY